MPDEWTTDGSMIWCKNVPIADVFLDGADYDLALQKERACRMAAANELYDALKAFVEMGDRKDPELAIRARHALAKARGESVSPEAKKDCGSQAPNGPSR